MALPQDPFRRLTAGATYSRAFQVLGERYELFFAITFLLYIPLAWMSVTLHKMMGSSLQTIMDMATAGVTTGDYNQRQLFSNSNEYVSSYDSTNMNGMGYSNEYSSSFSNTNTADYSVSVNLDEDEFAALGAEFAQSLASFGAKLLVEYIAFLIIGIAGEAAMAYAVAELYAGRTPDTMECLKKGFSRWCDLFGSSLLVGFGMGIGNLIMQGIMAGCIMSQKGILIFLAVMLFIGWIVVIVFMMVSLEILPPVLMIEGEGPINSLKRCWELSWDNRCYIFCTLFGLGVCLNIATIILALVVVGMGGPDFAFSTVGSLITTLPLLFYLPMAIM